MLFRNNFLQLNLGKAEPWSLAKEINKKRCKDTLSLSLKPKYHVGNVGVMMDSDLNFKSYTKSIALAVFYHLKNIESKPDIKILLLMVRPYSLVDAQSRQILEAKQGRAWSVPG